MTLLVLYEDLAVYFVKCISTFSKLYNVDVHIIHRKTSKDAPFQFDFSGIKTYNVEQYKKDELMNLASNIKPDAIFCGGWSNKNYLAIVDNYKNKIPTVVGFDNKWTGSLKQQIARVIAPFYITKKFSKCFVPSYEQKKFAMNIGFKESQIVLDAYSCDFDLFHNQYLTNKEQKQKQFPKRFIYVGRYVEHKGIKDLWSAFVDLKTEYPNDWELWCLGTGDVSPVQHSDIKHMGFVQPKDLPQYIKETGVFVLPSHFEPWGVVVHEYAAAGFPIVCTDEVGARIAFVENEVNGYIYQSGNVKQLKEALKKIMLQSDETLMNMGDKSVEKAKQITPEKWANKLMKLLNS